MNLTAIGPLQPLPVASAPAAPARVPLSATDLAGQVGAEVAAPLSAALERVNELAATGRIGRRSLRALREEIEQARRVAMTGQQILRLAAGRVRLAPEPVDLPRLLRDIVGQRGREMESRGLEVHKTLRPTWALVDPTLVHALLQALLDWAFAHCVERMVQLGTESQSWPLRARVVCEFAWRHADRIDTEAQTAFDAMRDGMAPLPLDTIDWRLVEHTARALGARVEREDSVWRTRVVLAFEGSVDGAAAPGNGRPHELGGSTLNSRPLAGFHVLVVSGRREVRNLVREAIRPTGMMVDFVTSFATAREFCLGGIPHAVVHDAALGPVEPLRDELHAQVPGVAFIEVSEQIAALEVASRGQAHEARIGLDAVPASLRSALEYTLGR